MHCGSAQGCGPVMVVLHCCEDSEVDQNGCGNLGLRLADFLCLLHSCLALACVSICGPGIRSPGAALVLGYAPDLGGCRLVIGYALDLLRLPIGPAGVVLAVWQAVDFSRPAVAPARLFRVA